jgi:hypothetical protein
VIKLLSTLVAAAMVLSGCADDSSSDGSTDDPSSDGSTDYSFGAFDVASTWFLNDDGELASKVPTESAQSLDWSLGEWAEGTLPPLWTGPVASQPYVITVANVTIQYRADATTGHSDSRPPFTIWFGAGDSLIEHAFAAGPNPFEEGDIQTITFEVDSLPLGGLVVEKGVSPILHVGSYYGDGQDQATVSVLFGAESSHVKWSGQTLNLPETNAATVVDESAQLNGGRCVVQLNIENSAQHQYIFEVGSEIVGIDASLVRVSGEGLGPDMDFFLISPEGEDVAHAAGPSTPEALHLRQPNLEASGPGTWTVAVYNCQPQTSTYELKVDLLTAT